MQLLSACLCTVIFTKSFQSGVLYSRGRRGNRQTDSPRAGGRVKNKRLKLHSGSQGRERARERASERGSGLPTLARRPAQPFVAEQGTDLHGQAAAAAFRRRSLGGGAPTPAVAAPPPQPQSMGKVSRCSADPRSICRQTTATRKDALQTYFGNSLRYVPLRG